MKVILTGAGGGIGSAIQCQLVATGHEVLPLRLDRPHQGEILEVEILKNHPIEATALVCCAGTSDPKAAISVNLIWTMELFFRVKADIYIAFSGGGVGGPPTFDMPPEYLVSKAGVTAFVEYFAALYPERQAFAIAPGLVDTKLNTNPTKRGTSPGVPAAFVCKLLTGKYRHLSGSLLAAQRDDLDTVRPMHLRRVAE